MLFDTLAKIFRASMDDREKVKLAQKQVETEDNVLVGEMLKRRPRLDPAKMQWFSEQIAIDLSVARTNKLIWDRAGRGLFVISMDGTPTTTLIRFNDIASSTYEVRAGHIKGAFQRIYLTNAAEAGKTLKFIVGYRNFAEFDLLGLDFATQTSLLALIATIAPKATAATIYNITMTTADSEYSQVLPEGCKQIHVVVADGTAARLAWVTGEVAADSGANWNLLANTPYNRSGLELSGKTLYFGCGTELKILKIEAWV